MLNKLSLLVLTLLLNLLHLEQSHAASSNDDSKQLFQQCTACHGDKGEGNDALNAPSIAGQEASYLLRQLQHFSAELRGKTEQSKPMIAMAKGVVSSGKADELAQYIENLPVISQKKTTTQGHLKNGYRYYQARCGACHGGEAQGNKSFNAPKLAGQRLKYLQRQMNDFVNGDRGYDQKDKFGRQMAMMAKTTTGKVLDDVLFYINSIDSNASQAK